MKPDAGHKLPGLPKRAQKPIEKKKLLKIERIEHEGQQIWKEIKRVPKTNFEKLPMREEHKQVTDGNTNGLRKRNISKSNCG